MEKKKENNDIGLINGVTWSYFKDNKVLMQVGDTIRGLSSRDLTFNPYVEKNEADLFVYGWIIEYKYKDEKRWEIYPNKKVYDTKETSLETIVQIKSHHYNNKNDFRVRPLYAGSKQYWRSHIIGNVLDD